MFQKLLHFDFANFKIHFHGMQNVYNILLAPRNLFRYVNKTYRLYLYFLNSLHIGHVRFVACACCIMCCSNSYLTIYWVLGRYKYKHSFIPRQVEKFWTGTDWEIFLGGDMGGTANQHGKFGKFRKFMGGTGSKLGWDRFR